MPLPLFGLQISAISLVPDRIVANFRYSLRGAVTMQDVASALADHGFERRADAVVGVIPIRDEDLALDAFITRPEPRGPLNVFVTLTPLSYARNWRLLNRGEVSVDGSDNYLHPSQVHQDNQAVTLRVDELFAGICNSIETLFQIGDVAPPDPVSDEDVFQLTSPSATALSAAQFVGITISRLEVCCDFASDHPAEVIDRVAPALFRRYRAVRQSGYRTSASSYDSLDGDLRVPAGYRRRRERYKAYAKTNRRVRMECEFGRSGALRAAGIEPSISHHNGRFSILFRAVAAHVATEFNAIIEDTSVTGGPGRTVVELLCALACRVTEPRELYRLVTALISNGRITRAISSRAVPLLHSDGVLTRTGRGLYSVSEDYRWALDDLTILLIENRRFFERTMGEQP